MPEDRTCATCRFWKEPVMSSSHGECRRFAPRTMLGVVEPGVRWVDPQYASFPEVDKGEWCGEWEART